MMLMCLYACQSCFVVLALEFDLCTLPWTLDSCTCTRDSESRYWSSERPKLSEMKHRDAYEESTFEVEVYNAACSLAGRGRLQAANPNCRATFQALSSIHRLVSYAFQRHPARLSAS
eukprot:5141698-Amphidinium_carterae.1